MSTPIESKEKKLDRAALERVAGLFRAFSEPTRLAILQELKEGARSVGELGEVLGTTQANVSKQLRVLNEAGVVRREKRGNQVFYSVEGDFVYPFCELACEKLNREARQRDVAFNFGLRPTLARKRGQGGNP